MLKLDTADGLVKASSLIGNYFAKAAEDHERRHRHHKTLAERHHAMNGHHTEKSALHKATAEGLPDDHELKHHHLRASEHHARMAEEHENISKAHHAEAASALEECKAAKAMASEFGAARRSRRLMNEGDTGACKHGKALDQECDACQKETEAVGGEGDGGEGAEKTMQGGIDGMVKRAVQTVMTKAIDTIQTSGQIEELVTKMVANRVAEELGGRTIPTSVSAINRTPGEGGSILFTRAGQPTEDQMTKGLDPEFQELIKIEHAE